MSSRAVVRRVDVLSAVRVIFSLSLAFWAIVVIGLIALYVLGLVSGGLGGVEGFIASLGFAGFRLSIVPFVIAFIGFAVLASALAAVFAAVGALLYNALSPLVGGVEVVTAPAEELAAETMVAAEPVTAPDPVAPRPVASPQPEIHRPEALPIEDTRPQPEPGL